MNGEASLKIFIISSFLLNGDQLLTHCLLVESSTYMLDESICHFRGVRSILSLLFYF